MKLSAIHVKTEYGTRTSYDLKLMGAGQPQHTAILPFLTTVKRKLYFLYVGLIFRGRYSAGIRTVTGSICECTSICQICIRHLTFFLAAQPCETRGIIDTGQKGLAEGL